MGAAGWGGFSNGDIPTSAMVQVESGDFLEPNAAAAWYAMQAACYAETGVWISINEAYRSLADQWYYWNLYQSGQGNVAAYPGNSNHGRGVAVDMYGYDAAWSWLQRRAGDFGWSWATGRASGERWHWEYVGGLSTGGTVASPINSKLDVAHIKALQAQLGVDQDGDAGPITTKALQRRVGTIDDGDFGPNSISSLQAFVGAGVDGQWGDQTTAAVIAKIDAGGFGAVVTTPPAAGGTGFEALGGDYVVRLQQQLAVDADGVVGPQTIRALQTVTGAAVDGVFGTESTEKLQAFIGAAVDGDWGNETTTKFRAAIDSNKFADTAPAQPPVDTSTMPAGYGEWLDLAWPQTATFDWATIKANFDGVLIKAGGAEDPAPAQIYGPAQLTDSHLTGARSVGLRVGFYWFNNGNVNVKAQADKFVEVLRTRIRLGDVIALDVENDGDSTPKFTPDQALEFANYMQAALGVKTLIYLNRSTESAAGWNKLRDAGHPLWLAVLDQTLASGIAAMSKIKTWPEATMVQYASTLGAPGYGAMNIDRNIGKLATLQSIAFLAFPNQEPTTPTGPDLDAARALAAQIAADATQLVTALTPAGI